MKNNYVLEHDFGYGRENEPKNLNKLKLRNIDDLKTYLNAVVECSYLKQMKNNIIVFTNSKVAIEIEML